MSTLECVGDDILKPYSEKNSGIAVYSLGRIAKPRLYELINAHEGS